MRSSPLFSFWPPVRRHPARTGFTSATGHVERELLDDAPGAKARPDDPQKCPVYSAMVQSLDEDVGRLVGALDELGIADRTLIVFLSDNGGNMYSEVEGVPPTSNAPLRAGKGTIYEGGIRVPCIVAWPGVVKAGSVSDALVSSVDFYPTLLEAADVSLPEGAGKDGVSQLPVLRGGLQLLPALCRTRRRPPRRRPRGRLEAHPVPL